MPQSVATKFISSTTGVHPDIAKNVKRNATRNGEPDCRPEMARSTQDRHVCRALASAAADSSPPMLRSGDEERTAGFAKEAAVKKRWRDYREGDGAYPGLRSLFGMN